MSDTPDELAIKIKLVEDECEGLRKKLDSANERVLSMQSAIRSIGELHKRLRKQQLESKKTEPVQIRYVQRCKKCNCTVDFDTSYCHRCLIDPSDYDL
jgi:hypothetical protein